MEFDLFVCFWAHPRDAVIRRVAVWKQLRLSQWKSERGQK
jgi:hypothetical protein